MVARLIRPVGNSKQTLFIVGFGSFMMLVIDLFFLGNWRYFYPSATVDHTLDVVPSYIPVPVEDYFNLPPEQDVLAPEPEEDMPESPLVEEKNPVDSSVDEHVGNMMSPANQKVISQLGDLVEKDSVSEWKKYAVSFVPDDALKAKVIIIIDDMGLNAKRSQSVLDLPSPLTLAYLPYAPSLDKQTQAAQRGGHELMIHTPMEPISATQDPGPMALLDKMDKDQVDQQLKKIFSSFDGYIGINNHMGSKLTQNTRIMRQVMTQLKDRGLVFIDSKTSSKSVAADIAADTGIYYAQRDVFLDHKATTEFVEGALKSLEEKALKRGYAIAIGHPKAVTVAALKEWIPTLKAKGIELAPVSAVLSFQSQPQQHLAQP